MRRKGCPLIARCPSWIQQRRLGDLPYHIKKKVMRRSGFITSLQGDRVSYSWFKQPKNFHSPSVLSGKGVCVNVIIKWLLHTFSD